jgi:D-alanyl-D-alanine carboxypeptidase (penicillin-binding protein 5/6)
LRRQSAATDGSSRSCWARRRTRRAPPKRRSFSTTASRRVWKGEAKDVAAGFVADKYVTLPKGKAEKLALSLTATEPLVAPVFKGQPVGTVKISLEGNPVAEFPLVALADVPAANVLGRAWDTVRLWFR